MTSKQVREKYIKFFISSPRNHKEIPSAPLVPENDPSTLFTGSGMQPLIPYLLGEKHPLGTRLVNSQKCFRGQDIDEVGDNRHTTFFEMLGNWSLGDYFKKEQLLWFFEFLVEELGLEPEKLYITVFAGNESIAKDTESIDIWKDIFAKVGIETKEGERIFAYPVEENWWSRSGIPDNMPPGEPGGPDSEVFYDFGKELKLHEKSPFAKERCHPNCECGRFLEVGNSVFMEYQKQNEGSFKKLPQRNVDFGGGLERLVAASENQSDIFKIDLFLPIIETVCKTTGKQYQNVNKPLIRIVADHLKAATFLVSAGVRPSNKTQGYMLRRLIRRAGVKLYKLKGKASEQDVVDICMSVVDAYKDTVYFDSQKDKKIIEDEIGAEISKFTKTINKGVREIEKIEKINGKVAFDLYQSYGFPLEIMAELFAQKGQTINRKQFEMEFKKHRDLSRSAAKGMFAGGLVDKSDQVIKLHTATHLLQQALRQVLGVHVRQKGSHITAKRLRFDFSHPKKLKREEIKKIENLVNKKIKENLPVSSKTVELKKAIKEGALIIPEAKYPEKVKVYLIGGPSADSTSSLRIKAKQVFSKEVCGGPHVDFTGRLGKFKIIKEEALGTGIRRIYAILEKNVAFCQISSPKKV